MLIIKEEKLEINESLSNSGHWKKGQQHTHKGKEEKNCCRGEINQIENKVAVEMIKKTKSKTMTKKTKRKKSLHICRIF